MGMSSLVIVESPAKASTVSNYLGKDFFVIASYGHVRDLLNKSGAVDPENNFAIKWEINEKSEKYMSNIIKSIKGVKTLYLATDPDREGEAISWHIYDILKNKNLLNGIDVKRIVFHEITKNAIIEAVENSRKIDQKLVEAYFARRVLDYLVGYSLSPILWQKLPGARSAGRVQSVALRLIVEREKIIEDFVSDEYWTINGIFSQNNPNESKNQKLIKKNEFKNNNEENGNNNVGEINNNEKNINNNDEGVSNNEENGNNNVGEINNNGKNINNNDEGVSNNEENGNNNVGEINNNGKNINNNDESVSNNEENGNNNVGEINNNEKIINNNDENNKETFSAYLYQFKNNKLGKMDIKNELMANEIKNELIKQNFFVDNIIEKEVSRNPAAPFITSTLQQEASRKLNFSAQKTMRVAQKLYEGVELQNGEKIGLITYMRTDSTNLSKEFISEARKYIKNNFEKNYLPTSERVYAKKLKNAQEAHEAIRPTSIAIIPNELSKILDEEHIKLYELIWKRTLASQMNNAIFFQVTAEIMNDDKSTIFRATGTTLKFPGYLTLYQEDNDEENVDQNEKRILPILIEKKEVNSHEFLSEQHFTQPQPRFTEASLVKKLEELGIGRPSTYASLIQVLQERGYASLEKKKFIPSNTGRFVTYFLLTFCPKYVEYNFTAEMEDNLDEIANGKFFWKNIISDFWKDFSSILSSMKEIRISEVIDKFEEILSDFVFKNLENRNCDLCENGTIGLRFGKFGAFLACNNYPECKNIKKIGSEQNAFENKFESISLGKDEETGNVFSIKNGPYGFYVEVELSEIPIKLTKTGKKRKIKETDKIKRISIPNGINPNDIDLAFAKKLNDLPKNLGKSEKFENDVIVSIGRFGPYIKCGENFISIPKTFDFLEIDLNDAVTIIEKKMVLKKMESPKVKRKKVVNKK